MFKISRRLDYGLQLMVTLAGNPDDSATPTALMAKRLQIPLPFLHQIGHSLMQAGLLKATPGPRGGLRLSRSAENISVYDIATAIEGPIALNPCLDCSSTCVRQDDCTSQFMWGDLQEKIIKYLSDVNLGMLQDNPSGIPIFSPVVQQESKSN